LLAITEVRTGGGGSRRARGEGVGGQGLGNIMLEGGKDDENGWLA